jgi:hypothetical protein
LLQVQYTALPHYEDKYEDFLADTVVLRRRFTQDGEQQLHDASSGYSGFAWLAHGAIHAHKRDVSQQQQQLGAAQVWAAGT